MNYINPSVKNRLFITLKFSFTLEENHEMLENDIFLHINFK